MSRQSIHTERAPQAIGPYSQAVRAGDTVYLSGQVPFDPATMQLVAETSRPRRGACSRISRRSPKRPAARSRRQ